MTTAPATMVRTWRPGARLKGVISVVVALVLAYIVIAIGAHEQATDQFINALTKGAMYALIALGYTMVYGIIELINFAHGEIFMCGTFVYWWLLNAFNITGTITDPLALVGFLVLAFIVSMTMMGVVGVVIERLAYRRLRNAPRLAPLITAIGVSFILQNLVFVGISNSIVTVPRIMANTRIGFGPIAISQINLFVIALALLIMFGLQLFVGRTRLGRAMRSTAIDREAAQLMGVDINTTIALTFFIGSALAGAAGVVQMVYPGGAATKFDLGFQAGLKSFTAAVLGGIGNTTGAALGGFVIGFIEGIADVFGYSNWSEAIVFGTLVIVLVFRPTGILGQRLGDRA
jgi:branched-chain amino acid transport system permease protein